MIDDRYEKFAFHARDHVWYKQSQQLHMKSLEDNKDLTPIKLTSFIISNVKIRVINLIPT